jgi:hypothetical protein
MNVTYLLIALLMLNNVLSFFLKLWHMFVSEIWYSPVAACVIEILVFASC